MAAAAATAKAEEDKKAAATAKAENEAEKARVAAAAAAAKAEAQGAAGEAGATTTAGTGMDYKSVAAISKAPANVKSKMHALFLCKFVSKPTAQKNFTSGVAIDLMGAAEVWATYKAGKGELAGDFTQPFLNEDKGAAQDGEDRTGFNAAYGWKVGAVLDVPARHYNDGIIYTTGAGPVSV